MSSTRRRSRSDRWHGRADFLRRVERRAASAPGPTRCWTPSSRARPAPAPSCSSACTRTCCGEIQGVLPERMHVVMPRRGLRPEPFRVAGLSGLSPAGAASARGGDRRRGDGARPIPSRCRNATSAAGGRAATAAAPPTTISASWPGSRSSRSRSCAAAGSTRWRRSRAAAAARVQPARGAPESYAKCASRHASSSKGGAPARRAMRCWRSCRAGALPPSRAFAGRCVSRPRGRSLRRHDRPRISARLDHGTEPGPARYHTRWAFDPAAERAAFEAFIDLVMERWQRFPGCTSITSRPMSRPRSSA